jgi:hypothetical protein
MKKTILTSAVILFIIVMISSCKKTNDVEEDQMAMLMNKEWKVVASSVDPAYLGITDWYAASPSCWQDNTSRFNPENVFIADEGPTKCDASDPQTTFGRWSYNTSTKRFIIDGPDYLQLDIIELTRSILRGTMKDNSGGIEYTYMVTMHAQ